MIDASRGARRVMMAVATVMLTVGCTRAAPPAGRTVDIAAPDGVTLKATLFQAASPGPAVLLLHQCDDRRTVWDPLGLRLAGVGITALALDYRGFGESGGPHSGRCCVPREDASPV